MEKGVIPGHPVAPAAKNSVTNLTHFSSLREEGLGIRGRNEGRLGQRASVGGATGYKAGLVVVGFSERGGQGCVHICLCASGRGVLLWRSHSLLSGAVVCSSHGYQSFEPVPLFLHCVLMWKNL